MLLYRHTQGHYLAVPVALRFAPGCGYLICFDGRDVPAVICAAFIRESGGQILDITDTIELRAPATACSGTQPTRRRQIRSSRRAASWHHRLADWIRGGQTACAG